MAWKGGFNVNPWKFIIARCSITRSFRKRLRAPRSGPAIYRYLAIKRLQRLISQLAGNDFCVITTVSARGDICTVSGQRKFHLSSVPRRFVLVAKRTEILWLNRNNMNDNFNRWENVVANDTLAKYTLQIIRHRNLQFFLIRNFFISHFLLVL